MMAKTDPVGQRWGFLLSAAVLAFVLIISAISFVKGRLLGMAVLSSLRFLSWLVHGLIVLGATLGLGKILSTVFGRRDLKAPLARRTALHFVTGWSLICLCGIITLALGVYTEMIWIPLFAVGVVVTAIELAQFLLRRKYEEIHIPSSTNIGALPALMLVTTLLSGAIWMAGIPPDTRDELTYHLLMPQQWALSGSWDQAPGNPHLFFPGNTEILFGWASATGGEGSPRFLALCAALLCLALLIEDRNSAFSRALTLAFVVLTPMMILAMSVAYVEYFLCLLILLGWRMSFNRSRVSTAPTGLAWGLALGVKYTAIPLIGLLFVEGLWKLGSGRRREQRLLIIAFLGSTLLLATPWYLRNLELRGDPVYPFGADHVSPESPAAREAEIITQFSPIPRAWRLAPWLYHAVENPLVDEHLHPLWTLLIPGIMFFGWKRRDLPWFSIAGMSLFFMFFRPVSRVLLPALTPACWWLPGFFDRVCHGPLTRMLWNLTLVSLVFLSLPFILGQWIVVDHGASMRYLVGEISAEKYLEETGILTPTVRYLETQTPAAAHVWVWGEDRVLYLRRWSRSDFTYCEPRAFLLAKRGEKKLDEAVRKWHIDYILISREQIADDFSTFSLHGQEQKNTSSGVIQGWLKTRSREILADQRFRLFQVSSKELHQ